MLACSYWLGVEGQYADLVLRNYTIISFFLLVENVQEICLSEHVKEAKYAHIHLIERFYNDYKDTGYIRDLNHFTR